MGSDRQEFGTVRNGSESPARTGRPPVLNDHDLRGLADQLNSRLGRPPRADELIEAAGGCQRKRALAAIKTLKLELAERVVKSGLQFPSQIENALRAQMAAWVDLAASHLADRHLQESERAEARVATQAALIEELQNKVHQLQRTVTDQERGTDVLRCRAQEAESALSQAEVARANAEVLAAERARVIEQLAPGVDGPRKKIKVRRLAP